MDCLDIVAALAFCVFIGWAVHKVFGHGNHGSGLLHYAFVGGCGVGIGALVEWITGIYAMTLTSAVVSCFIFATLTEFIIRGIKYKLYPEN